MKAKTFEEMTPEERIRRARTMLVLGRGDEPFYGSIALGFELIEHNSPMIPTAATTGDELIFNPTWIKTLRSIDETMGLVEHEVLHVAFKHPLRQAEMRKAEGDRFDENLWQMATDFAINPILVDKGRFLPGKPCYDPKYRGMSAERIYALLKEEKRQQSQGKSKTGPKDSGKGKGDTSGKSKKKPDKKPDKKQQPSNAGAKPDDKGQPQDCQAQGSKQQKIAQAIQSVGGASDPGGCGAVLPPMDFEKGEPANEQQQKDFEREFEARVVQAARIVEKDQGDIPGFLKDIVEAHTIPQVTYKDHLWELLDRVARDDYSMSRPNKRFEEVYIPSIYNKVPGELVVVIDTSGSVSRKEQEIYASEISGILEEFMDGLDMFIIYHDTEVRNTQELTPEDLPVKLEIRGGGGTRYKPVFDFIKKKGLEPKAVIWFTDLWVSQYTYSEIETPDWEHFWLNTSPRRHSNPPFGHIIDLDPNL